jgi:response regulator NasT
MLFRAQTYSVLMVSNLEKLNTSMTQLLPGSEYGPVTVLRSVGAARRRVMEQEFDLIVINAPLPDEFGLQFALDLCTQTQAGVLLTVRQERYEDLYDRAVSGGVVLLPRPTSVGVVSQHFSTLCSIRERLRQGERREQAVEEKVQEIRLVNRAKWLLIQKGMSEEEAHRYLTRQAMDRRCPKAEVARALLEQAGQ